MKSLVKSAGAVLDLKYLTITDLSVYNTDVPVTNSVLRITLPNWNKYVDVAFTPNTVLNVNSNMLLLSQVTDPELLSNLPSGIYKIRHSICPNDKLFYEYNVFNIEPELDLIACTVCSNADNPEVLKELFELKYKLELAKTLGESCSKEKEAVILFNLISKRINGLAAGHTNCQNC